MGTQVIRIAYTDRKDFVRRICILAPDTAGMVRLGARMDSNTQFVEYGKLGEFKADGFNLADIRQAIGEYGPSKFEKESIPPRGVDTRDCRQFGNVKIFKTANSRPPREVDFTGVSGYLQDNGKFARRYAR